MSATTNEVDNHRLGTTRATMHLCSTTEIFSILECPDYSWSICDLQWDDGSEQEGLNALKDSTMWNMDSPFDCEEL